jgi:hypothetical protein
MSSLRFQVDSRIATLLSQEYASTERALKELVDNGWDADAGSISITLPKPMSDMPIVVEDDGDGMTEEELRRHYLFIASDRRTRRGDCTTKKQRRVKGRKGVGKFAGLMAAAIMQVETWARGRLCGFTLRIADLAKFEDIEQLPLQLYVEDADPAKHGTRITLTSLHQGLAFPNPDTLRQKLLQEYGREEGFVISVDGKTLGVNDAPGVFKEADVDLQGVGKVNLRFSISGQKNGLRQPGITIKVGGKSVGKPGFFGLDNSDDFPPKLLRKLYGELEADGLSPHVTAGWDSLVENSELYHTIEGYVQPLLREAFKEQYGKEMQLAQARLQRQIHERLASLPEYKREYAERAIKKVLDKYYGEPESKVEPMVFVLLEALERTDYRVLLEHIADAPRRDIAALAESLNDFSLAEMAFLGEQANARKAFLDNLECLCEDAGTLESTMHKAIQNALWIFGPEYSLFSSNQTLKNQVEKYLHKKYAGEMYDKRPDLLLNEDLNGAFLLIEFKRPAHSLNFSDYQQATGYRHEFGKHTDKPIRVLLVAGKRSADFPQEPNREPEVRAILFNDVISTARRQLDWLLKQLGNGD